MDSKIQELASKIYKDGVEKASAEATSIIATAEKKRDEILLSAKKEAENIVENAKKEAAVSLERAVQEIRMSVTNAKEALKAEITDLLTYKSVSAGVADSLGSPEVLRAIVMKMCEEMLRNDGGSILVSSADEQSLEAYFQKHAEKALQEKISIRSVAGNPAHFELSPVNGSYKIAVSEDAFNEYFFDYLRPRLKTILFGEEK